MAKELKPIKESKALLNKANSRVKKHADTIKGLTNRDSKANCFRPIVSAWDKDVAREAFGDDRRYELLLALVADTTRVKTETRGSKKAYTYVPDVGKIGPVLLRWGYEEISPGVFSYPGHDVAKNRFFSSKKNKYSLPLVPRVDLSNFYPVKVTEAGGKVVRVDTVRVGRETVDEKLETALSHTTYQISETPETRKVQTSNSGVKESEYLLDSEGRLHDETRPAYKDLLTGAERYYWQGKALGTGSKGADELKLYRTGEKKTAEQLEEENKAVLQEIL